MGRYTGPICRLCRREGMKLCDKHKCASIKRNFPPGMHGQKRQPKQSDYAKQLREKQKTRRVFGVSEKQLQKAYKLAIKSEEISGEELIRQLEHRFDNIIFRSGFASSRRQARQLVAHGVFTLNGKRLNIPSAPLKTGDIFSVRERNKSMSIFEDFSKKSLIVPSWIKVDQKELTGTVSSIASKDDLEKSVDPQMIIEFYSR